MSERHGIEDEISTVIAEAREKGDLETRLDEIEESIFALARYLDKAFAEIHGEIHGRERDTLPPSTKQSRR